MLTDLDLPAALATPDGAVTLRRADVGDLDALMRLLADDAVSASRGDLADAADAPAYRAGLVDTLGDPSNDLLVVVGADEEVVAMMQLTRIPGLARRGATRVLIEAVRVSSARRSSGIGSAMMRWSTQVAAPALGAALVQLTSDEARTDAHRFYERLGFVGSHRGFKFRVGESALR
ncbi:GNAT family N-acetyltransferase [Herbiconiux sp. CPCC 205716]|uniref:GNAT family N-acetyltransferase n=1 Tax=Herbiconiux gentiana TaxID=2970912 RepID=A0ABT2GIN8_9MICO|nr:GNAT family N-acetyltransferase [Herbiconiux gentiana]MCS5716095.1 GNAT family N-acetyltransferase [Herbiconiux gentiana]